MKEVWIGIATGNRARRFGRLLDDLEELATANDVRLTALIAENSAHPEERSAVLSRLGRLEQAGHHVVLDASQEDTPIDVSRKRVRRLIAQRGDVHPPPEFVWMLDDDVRLTHEHWTPDGRKTERLHDPLAFLLQIASTTDFDALIGEVTGDPPIPPAATYASRLTDLAVNLRRIEQGEYAVESKGQHIGAPGVLSEHDCYYDFSTSRENPTWSESPRHLPRRPHRNSQDALDLLLDDIDAIPVGGSFTRPILAVPEKFERWLGHTNSGPNRVFFDVETCIAHPYPAVQVGDIRTRRSDMIGASVLKHRGQNEVVASKFSVWHRRCRRKPWPSRRWLARNLVGDTLGALLARHVKAQWDDRDVESWYQKRLDMMRRAAAQWSTALADIVESRTFHQGDRRLQRLVSWARNSLPLAASGELDSDVLTLLESSQIHRTLESSAMTIVEQQS